jgi:zinc protease
MITKDVVMTLGLRARVALVATVLLSGSVALGARQQLSPSPADTAALTDRIPADAVITTGTLSNGLRYYVRKNAKPEKRAELRLIVNAGSVLEDEDQRGLAHFVEHMAFNGTTHFPKMGIVSFLESVGMKFGAHINAETSFDDTTFMLTIPTDRPDVMDKSMLILEDWAHAVTFDPAEIERERGVIMEEWRLGRGADARLLDKQLPVLLKGSRYADRLPIGLTDVIQHAKPEAIKRFYADWYRPDLMAVIAVGDFDKAAVEALIKQHFGSLPKAVNPKPRPTYNVPDAPGTRFTIATDKEATSTDVSVYALMKARPQTTVGDYRRQIVENLYGSMLSDRMAELSKAPNAPFLGAGVGSGAIVRTEEAMILNAAAKENQPEVGLAALFIETARVQQFGFTATELDRAKQNVMRSYDQAVTEKDNEPSGSFAAEYGRNFTTEEPMPGIVYEQHLHHRFLPTITLDEVNALAKDWAPDRNRVVVVSAPEKAGVTPPTEAGLTAAMNAASSRELRPYVDDVTNAPLMDKTPVAGTVTKTAAQDQYGITEWTLSNGAKVVLKPTTFKTDEVVFRAFSLGGTSLASDADLIAAQTAPQVVALGGLGQLNASDLRKSLTGKIADVGAGIGDTDQELGGSASTKDLETLFQLIYMKFTEPRADPQMFGVMTSQAKAMLANQANTPEYAFGEALTSALTGDSPRAKPFTVASIDQMDLAKSMAFYKARFADASAFTFVFVGSFDLATMKPLVEKYLGSLPATHANETWKDAGVHYPKGVITKRVEKGIEPKSQAALVFTGPFQYDATHRVVIRAMAAILQNRLIETLRQDLGGTYSVTVSASYDKVPQPDYSVSIEFGCDPARTDELIKRALAEIEAFKAKGPTPEQLNDVKQSLIRDFETNSQQNGYVVSQVSAKYEYNESLDTFFHITDLYKAIDAKAIQDAFKAYFDTGNYVQVTLFPEKKGH